MMRVLFPLERLALRHKPLLGFAVQLAQGGGLWPFDPDVCATFLSTTEQCRTTKAREF